MACMQVQNWNKHVLAGVQGGSIVIGINTDFGVTLHYSLVSKL